MQETNTDLFQVYVREHRNRKESPELVERPVAVCAGVQCAASRSQT